jgi:tRNA-Thr(GGU) m(6)t(6)A37 methyltransferase TsaA
MKKNQTAMKPIGYVRKGRIVLDRRWEKGLKGIEGFSHILALFWMHRAHKTDLQISPKSRMKFPSIGFLATRSAHRLNPIGLTVLKLIRRKGCVLWVKGLDAWEGTPVLDLKPYTKREALKDYRMPAWVKKLDALETDPLRKYGS